MMEHGIHLVFTGHQHLQDIAQYRVHSDAGVDSLIDISTGSAVGYPNPWRMIRTNTDFTRWDVSTGYISSIPSIANLRQECYKRSSTNIVDGLVWHINEYWPTIESYRSVLPTLGVPAMLLPNTPQEAGELIMEYLGDSLRDVFMIHLTGNENDNPRGQVLIADIDAAVKQLCIQRMKGSGDDASLDATVGLIHTLLMAYLKPILTSMLTDTNQEMSSLSSRTNDLDVVLNIPGAK